MSTVPLPRPLLEEGQTRGRNEILLPRSHGLTTGAVINRIEDVLHQIQLDLLQNWDLSIPYRSRHTPVRAALQDCEDNAEITTSSAVRFPGSTPHEARKFGA